MMQVNTEISLFMAEAKRIIDDFISGEYLSAEKVQDMTYIELFRRLLQTRQCTDAAEQV